MNKQFSIGEAVKFGWEGMKRHFWLFFGLIVIAFVISGLIGVLIPCNQEMMQGGADQMVPKQCFWPSLIHFLVNVFFVIGFTHVSLKIAKGEKPTFADFWNRFGLYLKMLGAEVLYTLVVIAGVILLVFPGIIWALKFCLYPFMVVDKGAGSLEALKLSSKATHGAKWDLLGWYMVSWLILLAGIAVIGVGLLAAVPVVLIGKAFIYRKLIGE